MVNTTMLAWQWETSIETATTLTSTTVCAVQFYPANKCSCHFFTRQGQLCFPPLCTKWYLDALVSSTVSNMDINMDINMGLQQQRMGSGCANTEEVDVGNALN